MFVKNHEISLFKRDIYRKNAILVSMEAFINKLKKHFGKTFHTPIFAIPKRTREFSSAGSEHLPYKQRVTGSNPVTPT